MTFQEREELQAEWNAREDYLSEAFGGEARLLEMQAQDDEAHDAGFSS